MHKSIVIFLVLDMHLPAGRKAHPLQLPCSRIPATRIVLENPPCSIVELVNHRRTMIAPWVKIVGRVLRVLLCIRQAIGEPGYLRISTLNALGVASV